LVEGDNADLFSVGTDETNRAEMDLFVDTDFIFDAELLPGILTCSPLPQRESTGEYNTAPP
jgi:hypothetical protein